MSDNRWVFRKSDGQFCFGRGPDPVVYLTDQVGYGLADIGEGAPLPDERAQKWDAIARSIVQRSPAEIAAFDATQPKVIKTRDLLRRITADEHDAIEDLAKTNKLLKRMMRLMLSDGTTDVNHPEFVQGWAYIKSIGIPAVWPDAAAADAAIARIRA